MSVRIVSDKGDGEPNTITMSQFRRLKSLENSGRINKIVLEMFDWWTDVVFLAVLNEYSTATDNALLSFLATTTSGEGTCPGEEPPERNTELYRGLFVASLCVLFINFFWRLFVALAWVRKRKQINGCNEWLTFASGVMITVIEPSNGLLIIDRVLDPGNKVSEDEKRFVKREILLQTSLIFTENIPQFIIQIIFALNSKNDFAVAWYVTTIVTVLHLIAQVIEVAVQVRRYAVAHSDVPLLEDTEDENHNELVTVEPLDTTADHDMEKASQESEGEE